MERGRRVEYLNPDDVARDRFGDWNSQTSVLQAAKWVTARRDELLSQDKGIAFETVFSTYEKLDFVRRAKDAGYFIRLFYIGTSSPIVNAARVTRRMLEGGHGVPLEKIISRYSRANVNLTYAIPIADRIYIYDNSVDNVSARLVLRIQDGDLRKIYGDVPVWVSDAVGDLPRHPDFVDLRA